jgi:hypothetical protein
VARQWKQFKKLEMISAGAQDVCIIEPKRGRFIVVTTFRFS